MRKKILLSSLLVMFALVLFACTQPVELQAITISGADNVTLDFQEEFNVLTGVTALGNDEVDYSDQITYTSTSTITNDLLDTSEPGNHVIKYTVAVGEVLAEKFRTVTVNPPQAVEGEMLVNADFSNGTAGWDTYADDTGSIVLSTEEFDGNPALKAEVVAGTNAYVPRFTQMNVPFENGKTYEISFKAKSSVAKTINLQVGEILASDPWFVDFKPGLTINKVIGTEWATYAYKFTMNQGEENQRGGVLFELGKVGEERLDATMYFDDIMIEESTPDADETAPAFTGLSESKSVLLGNDFDPMNGVTAFDVVDGDVTDDVVVEIKDASDAVQEAVDTSVEGTWTITYTVSDEAGNEEVFVMALEVVGMQFAEDNLLVNGSFDAALGDPAEWVVWSQNWGTAPAVAGAVDDTNGVYTLDISNGGGDAAWAVQLQQAGITLVEGNTYRVVLTAKSSVERTVNIAIGYGDPWVEYARFNDVTLGTEDTTQEFVFTVTQPTYEDVMFVIEAGTTANFSDSVITIDEAAINVALLDQIIANGMFNDGWTVWSQNWGDMPNVTYDRTDGQFNITTDKAGEANWAIQFNQTLTLEPSKTYVFSVDAMASVARDINIKIFTAGYTNYLEALDFMLTTDMTTYTWEFTTPAEGQMADLTLTFEMGATANFAAGTVSLDNISLKEKDNAEAPEIIVNGDATTVPDFMFFGDGAEASMMLGEDGAELAVTTLGAEAYQPHVYQMIDSLAAGNYVLKVVVSADVARDLRLNLVLPDAGYASALPDGKYDYQTVENDQVVVYVSFTVENDLTNVKLELDFGNLGGELTSAAGNFVIEEVLIYQNFN